jgi:hypothetical protein
LLPSKLGCLDGETSLATEYQTSLPTRQPAHDEKSDEDAHDMARSSGDGGSPQNSARAGQDGSMLQHEGVRLPLTPPAHDNAEAGSQDESFLSLPMDNSTLSSEFEIREATQPDSAQRGVLSLGHITGSSLAAVPNSHYSPCHTWTMQDWRELSNSNLQSKFSRALVELVLFKNEGKKSNETGLWLPSLLDLETTGIRRQRRCGMRDGGSTVGEEAAFTGT